MPKYSWAPPGASRKPTNTSSKINTILRSVHTLRTRRSHCAGARRASPCQHEDDGERQRQHLGDLPKGGKPVVRLLRKRHRPADDADGGEPHGPEAPCWDARRSLAHVLSEGLTGDEGKRGDEHESAIDRPTEQVHARHVLKRQSVAGAVAAEGIEQT